MQPVIIEHLIKKFGSTVAINDMNLTIQPGKITGIIGADGASKSTLLRLLIGLIKPDSGKISVFGMDPIADKEKLSSYIGYMPQKFGLYEDLTVLENLTLYADLKEVPHDFDEMLKFTALTPFQNRMAGKLSGGMKQKLGLACALLGSPKFLVLDEPSVGVDPISRRDLMRMVRELITPETTVIWSTAYLDEAQTFDTAVVIYRGNVIYNGAPSALATTTTQFEEKVIELMGGYTPQESAVAKKYSSIQFDGPFTVEADNLAKCYGKFYAVKNNSFQIRRGEIFGLLGPNGAGKSTSFKMMCGLSKPSDGTCRIMGIDIIKEPERARSRLGYMAQKFSLYGSLTVKQNLDFFAAIYGIPHDIRSERINEIIRIFNFEDIKNKQAENLPLGYKQRLSMAAALIHNPAILFLDEPTSGVDIITRREFWEHIRGLAKKGVTILITTHFMDEAEFCDRISLFYKGETISIGTPAELKAQAGANNMEDTFITLIKNWEEKLKKDQ